MPKWTCKTAVYQGEQLRARTHFVITAIITAIINIIITAAFHLHYYYMYTFISIITYPRHTSVKYYTFICLILSEGDLLLFIYNGTYSFYVDILRTFQHKICIWHFYTPFIEAKRQVQKPWTQSLMWNLKITVTRTGSTKKQKKITLFIFPINKWKWGKFESKLFILENKKFLPF